MEKGSGSSGGMKSEGAPASGQGVKEKETVVVWRKSVGENGGHGG